MPMSTVPATAAAPTATRPPKLRLGDVLVQQKLVSDQQLQQALEEGKQTGKRLGRLLIERGVVTEDAVVQALATQLRVPFVNLKTYPLRSETVRRLPESPALRHRAILLKDKGDHLTVAVADEASD